MRSSTIRIMLIALLLVGLFSVGAFADDISREQSTAGKFLHKLGRGITNMLTGWIEIPKNIAVNWEKTDPFTGLIVGSIKGIGWSWTRTVSGLYDVFTFPFPVPENYRPLMEPEFVLPSIWGAPLPVSERLAR